MTKHLPNFITLINLLCGCGAIVSVLNGKYELMIGFVLAAQVLDFADGLVARALGQYSEIGKQLDSLADMVSFGVVPGAIMFTMLQNALGASSIPAHTHLYWAMPGFVITLFSCLRLAKFNLDSRQTTGFIGLPTPANTNLIMGIFIYYLQSDVFDAALLSLPVLYAITLVSSLLLVAELPMVSNKFKGAGWRGNELRYIFIALLVVGLLWLRLRVLAPLILLYIVFSVFIHLFKPTTKS